MAHKIEHDDHMFSGEGVTPWHKLGTVVKGLLTAEEAITAAKLDWDVELAPLYHQWPGDGDGDYAPIASNFATRRATDGKVLGVVGAGYRVLQNREAFGFLDEIVSKGHAMYVTAGSLEGGRCIWLLVRVPGEIVIKRPGGKKDQVQKYMLLTNRHDGFGTASIKLTPIRVVCFNTLSQALRGGALHIRHTASVVDRVGKAYEALGLVNETYQDLGEAFNAMARVKLTDDQARSFMLTMLKRAPTQEQLSDRVAVDQDEEEEKVPRLLTTALNLYEGGRGAELARGTLWGAYNALTELADHHMNYRSTDTRMRNVWFEGHGQALKLRAFATAKGMVARTTA